MLPTIQNRIVNYCQKQNYVLSRDPGQKNIIYVEDMDSDGDLNTSDANEFNDLRLVFDHNLSCVGCWEATTEPGKWYTQRPMNPLGAFRIAFGQYKAWKVGFHGNSDPHESLIQVAAVDGFRDANKDMMRTGDRKVSGLFGINQHWGYDLPSNDIGKASAGCLVGRSRKGHRQFMEIVKSDPRYRADRNYLFSTIVIPGNEI